MPLVHPTAIEHEASERQRAARKIKPQYTEGPLVKVANVSSRLEADMVAGLLLEEGIPCLLRQILPEGANGQRAVLVHQSGADAAREALAFERD